MIDELFFLTSSWLASDTYFLEDFISVFWAEKSISTWLVFPTKNSFCFTADRKGSLIMIINKNYRSKIDGTWVTFDVEGKSRRQKSLSPRQNVARARTHNRSRSRVGISSSLGLWTIVSLCCATENVISGASHLSYNAPRASKFHSNPFIYSLKFINHREIFIGWRSVWTIESSNGSIPQDDDDDLFLPPRLASINIPSPTTSSFWLYFLLDPPRSSPG